MKFNQIQAISQQLTVLISRYSAKKFEKLKKYSWFFKKSLGESTIKVNDIEAMYEANNSVKNVLLSQKIEKIEKKLWLF